ncbi:MAG TPA: SIS domain-containing protein [Nitrosopumilaceae archaeon]|nr:SIS domain-containing protein [Nitrosopumilaceae archaeon]
MLDIETLNKFDTKKMYAIYDRWAEIAKNAYDSNLFPVDFKNIDHIVFAGMGGSGALGDIFAAILSKTNIHVTLVKGYTLPKTVDSGTLVVVTSVSGNTVETLTVLESANKIGCKIIAFSDGGKIQEYCVKEKIEYRKIPQHLSPRSSFTEFLYSILRVLEPILPIGKQNVFESIEQMENLSKSISSKNLSESNPSLKLAEWINGIPMIYYPWGLQAAATRFKNSLQENAKIHAMVEDVIEAGHNGIVSWEKPSRVQPILLEGDEDYIKTKDRWNIMKEYFKENNIDYKEVFSIKGNILSKLINLIYFLDYCSIYCAVLSETDPTPIRSIDYVKRKL